MQTEGISSANSSTEVHESSVTTGGAKQIECDQSVRLHRKNADIIHEVAGCEVATMSKKSSGQVVLVLIASLCTHSQNKKHDRARDRAAASIAITFQPHRQLVHNVGLIVEINNTAGCQRVSPDKMPSIDQ